MSRRARLVAVLTALLLTAAPGVALASESAVSAQASSPFAGLGAWVDVFDWSPTVTGGRPTVTVDTIDTIASSGVQTLYLQSSRPTTATLVDPTRLRQLVTRAHQRGLKVVLWYLPTHTDEDRDLRHLRAAAGEPVEGVGIDIESTDVASVAERNRRAVRLVQQLDAATTKPLVAITPSPTGLAVYAPKTWWPAYPFAQLRPSVDAFATMTYWSYRKGAVDAGDYTTSDVRRLRCEAQDPRTPVHVIGSPTTSADVLAFTSAVRRAGAVGGSLYDWMVTPSSLHGPLRDLRR